MENEIKFNLVENALESINNAIESFIDTSDITTIQSRLKHSITNTSHAVELLLKERLKKEHPSLIWQNIDKYPSLDANTVNIDTCLKRLDKIANVKISEKDINIIKSLNKTRNAIIHYEWVTTENEAKLIVGSSISFIVSYAQRYLDIDIMSQYKDDENLSEFLLGLPEFSEEHEKRLYTQMRESSLFPVSCQSCGYETFSLISESCELCGHWEYT